MPPSEAVRRIAIGAALLIGTSAAFGAFKARAATIDELDTARREAIEAARETQQRERAAAAIEHEIGLLDRDAQARRRGLDESRSEQSQLLEVVLHRARSAARDDIAATGPLIDNLRGKMLMQEIEPALRAQARALTGEIDRIAQLRQRIAARREDESAARQALAAERGRLADAIARRNALARDMLPPEDLDAALRIAEIAAAASDFADLIRRAEAPRGEQPAARSRSARAARTNPPPPGDDANPTRPRDLHSLASAVAARGEGNAEPRDAKPGLLVTPVAGTIARRFGEPAAPGLPGDGLSLHSSAGAVVVAPFDGKVVYAGPFRQHGLVLIMRHDHLYHSVLAGLDRVESKLDDWVLAGEPVGAMPDAPSPRSRSPADETGDTAFPGGLLYFELRREGRPVDLQPWLASDEGGREERNGAQRVRQ